MVTGGQAAAFEHFCAHGQRFTGQVELVGPAAPEMAEAVGAAAGQMPLGREDALDRQGGGSGVSHGHPAFEQVIGGVNPVVQDYFQGFERIPQVQAEFVPALFGFGEAQNRIADAIGVTGLETGFDIF